MAVLRTRVTGPVMLPDGSPAPNGSKVIFRLRSWDRQDGALIMKGPEEAVVVGGVIDKTLNRTSASERGTLYDVIYTYPNAAARGQWLEEPLGSISLTGPGPVALADLLALPAPVPNVPDALAQALGAAAGASADAGRAEDAADRADAAAASVAVSQFETRAEADGGVVPPSISAVRTLGNGSILDGGGAALALAPDFVPGPGGFTDESGRAFSIVRAAMYDAAVFGIHPGDDNAAPRLAAAIAYLKATGKEALILFRPETYFWTQSVRVQSGVGLFGAGCGQYPAAAYMTAPEFLATRRTRFMARPGFPAGQYMLDVNVQRGDAYCLQNVLVEGILIDQNLIATHGLRWRAIKHSRLRDVGTMQVPTNADCLGIKFDTAQGRLGANVGISSNLVSANSLRLIAAAASPRDDWFNGATITVKAGPGAGQSRTIWDYNGATKIAYVTPAFSPAPDTSSTFEISGEVTQGNGATQFNIIENVWAHLGNNGWACGMEFDGDGVHDLNQNTYHNLRVVHANGPGARFFNGDTEWIDGFATYSFGVGWGAEFYGSNTSNYEGYCRQMFFNNCLFGGASQGGRGAMLQGATGTTATLDAGASAVDGYYVGKPITITGGTGEGQVRWITAYNGTTKVATVDSAWLVTPTATSYFSTPPGGGVALFAGTYRASRWHTFSGYETHGNGAGKIWAQAGAAFIMRGEGETILGDTDGHDLILASMNAWQTGTQSKLAFQQMLKNGIADEVASIRHLSQDVGGNEAASLLFYTRNSAGSLAERFRVSPAGVSINSGATLTGLLTGTLSHTGATVAAGAALNIDITVSGAVVGSGAIVNCVATIATGLTMDWVHVSAANTVRCRLRNNTAGAVDLAAASWRATVFAF
ncbi:hypothetical protein [Paracoccus sp. IB05]|uniref:hypothetical protein n=1 Tax=Paracoccus sp. IB05 TaxID=2779367 RepID=UPI0018E7E68D|nr:hypothetical protein [Paracoccus sp. IB05]MBJ2150626.1 hypothetical protein [Paracoccus sp. IB05]